jgi:uncharacterized metal-binding protein
VVAEVVLAEVEEEAEVVASIKVATTKVPLIACKVSGLRKPMMFLRSLFLSL